MSRDFKSVYYYMPWKSAFPKRSDACVGEGIPGVERIYDFWDYVGNADLIIFPDVYDADLQVFLRKQGKRVWGSGNTEWLELDRMSTRKLQKELKVAAPPTKRIVGIEKLKDHLKEHNDLWVKVSAFRGDQETWHHIKYFTSEPFLNDLARGYGPLGESMEFVVEDNIEGVEIGYDGYTVDGQWPDKSLFGIEVKDLGYLGVIKPYAKLPEQIQEVNSKFAPILKEGKCRSFVSFEMRINKSREPVVIDPCMRCGSPCFEVWQELYENLAEIFWYGAEGKMVNPKPIAKWAVMAMIHCSYATKNWTPLFIPPKVRKYVKIRNLTQVGGHSYFVPQRSELPEIGAVIGMGDSMQEAIDQMEEVEDQVDGYQVIIHKDSLDKAKEAAEQAEKYGIHLD